MSARVRALLPLLASLAPDPLSLPLLIKGLAISGCVPVLNLCQDSARVPCIVPSSSSSSALQPLCRRHTHTLLAIASTTLRYARVSSDFKCDFTPAHTLPRVYVYARPIISSTVPALIRSQHDYILKQNSIIRTVQHRLSLSLSLCVTHSLFEYTHTHYNSLSEKSRDSDSFSRFLQHALWTLFWLLRYNF